MVIALGIVHGDSRSSGGEVSVVGWERVDSWDVGCVWLCVSECERIEAMDVRSLWEPVLSWRGPWCIVLSAQAKKRLFSPTKLSQLQMLLSSLYPLRVTGADSAKRKRKTHGKSSAMPADG
jgi:hypothetical protein